MSHLASSVTPAEASVKARSREAEQLHTEVVLHDGTRLRVRPIQAKDVELERCFIKALSPATRRYRFLETIRSPSEALLKLMTNINPATDAAFVAILGTGEAEVGIGVGRFSALPDSDACEFAVTVADQWQHKGLGTLLMKRLVETARARGFQSMFSSDASDNTRMRQFAEHLHFHHKQDPDDARLVRYRVDLTESEPLTTP